MTLISIATVTRCNKHPYSSDWFGDASTPLTVYREGDDDDDGGYDYAPAA